MSSFFFTAGDDLSVWELTGERNEYGIPMAHFVQNVTPLSEIADDLLAQDLDAELRRIQP